MITAAFAYEEIVADLATYLGQGACTLRAGAETVRREAPELASLLTDVADALPEAPWEAMK